MNVSFALLYRSDYFRLQHHLPAAFWWYPYAFAESGFKINGVDWATVNLPDGDQVSFKKDESGNWGPTDPSVNLGGVVITDVLPPGDVTEGCLRQCNGPQL